MAKASLMLYRRGQGAFEYILMLSGVLLVVITITYMLQGSLAQADNTLDAQMKAAGIALDPTYYTPGAKPQFLPSTPADGTGSTTRPNISAAITVKDAALNNLQFNWNGTNYSLYDQSLVLALNFDDASMIGDTALRATDVSTYGNNGAIYGDTAMLLHMDESGGRNTFDESRYKNNGTCYTNGAVSACDWAAGKSNTGVFLNGSSYIQFPDVPAYDPAGDFAFEAWINQYSYSFLNGIVIHGSTETVPGFYIRAESASNVQFAVNTGTTFKSVGSNSFPSGQWSHLVAMKTGNTLSVYRNGVPVASTNFGSQAWNPSSSDALMLGYVHGRMFNGSIDEVAFYTRSLTAAEIFAHYKAGRAKHANWGANGTGNSAMVFDGINDYVNLSNPATLQLSTGAKTVEMWVKLNSFPASSNIQGLFYAGATGGGTGYGMAIRSTSGDLWYEIYGSSGGRQYFQQPIGITTDQWQHVVAVFDAANRTMTAYRNGKMMHNASIANPGNVLLNSYQFTIGSYGHGGDWFFNGSLDEVRVWNRSLTPAEVEMHYRSSLNKYTQNAWFFDFKNETLPVGIYNYTLYTSGGYRKDASSETRTVKVCASPFLC